MKSISDKLEQELASPRIMQRRRLRAGYNRGITWMVAASGLSVILAITLIFFYLLYEVMPLFQSASTEHRLTHALHLSEQQEPLALLTEEQDQLATLLTADGTLHFIDLVDQQPLATQQLALQGRKISAVSVPHPSSRLLLLGLDDGRLLVIQPEYPMMFDQQGQRIGVNPRVHFPLGDQPLPLGASDQPIRLLHHQQQGGELSVAAVSGDQLLLVHIGLQQAPSLQQPSPLRATQHSIQQLNTTPDFLLTTPGHRQVYLANQQGQLQLLQGQQDKTLQLLPAGQTLTGMVLQLGNQSLLTADSAGKISQWFMVRDEHQEPQLTRIRSLQLSNQPVTLLVPEFRRKGLAAVDASGQLGIFNTTAENRSISGQLLPADTQLMALSPRGSLLLAVDKHHQLHGISLDNPHPEVSFKALWSKVWYEGYQEPSYTWQSSSASNEFEPKFSLTPLAFGTLKAAFYAMLLSIPLAICGAMYTAFFMAPALRRKIKPIIELMEALPTVVLGFFAGLFLAPFVEQYLPGIFALLLLLPLSMLVFGYLWFHLPDSMKYRIPDGWHSLLLIPIILLTGWLALSLSQPLESQLFAGNMQHWLSSELGIPYDQRNALVVGFAMGFAVIPTIYSIAEDALFGVPRSLSHGSLALGATPWQTLVRVILPTASPGIFSAIMIGTGRAVGETMIVLMATGNTPIMNANIFEGMRTLAANIAVEMGESAVGSTHYRILFMAALVLFVFTFMVNTLAELVRQRLRHKYSRL
ncbi:MAG: ABC transporter permease subunit [Marinospirillum sp.]|uniref:ABC transporter permease subunit n=1 Tax=Marinospirillum sp. TaxID=2183934 RepID=UPI0019F9D89F|nr:ABC transporter permease subunit [Marinospirillum sp.]MBE0507141.1 ABC transporter permease subunit [Marinospirillum sp.]